MGLRQTAEIDLKNIVEDDVHGFGWSITVTNPALLSKPLKGFSNDISQIIDPDTGQAVSGRSASVVLIISSLISAGFAELPVGIADRSIKPWLIAFNDINGNSYTFKVSKSNPDRALGVVVCVLEKYIP